MCRSQKSRPGKFSDTLGLDLMQLPLPEGPLREKEKAAGRQIPVKTNESAKKS